MRYHAVNNRLQLLCNLATLQPILQEGTKGRGGRAMTGGLATP